MTAVRNDPAVRPAATSTPATAPTPDEAVDAGILYRRAAAAFEAVASQVRDDQWTLPTPCPDWDVRALTAHVAAEGTWAAPMLTAFDERGPGGGADATAAAESLREVAADHLLHSWDLAVAIGVPDRLDPALVAAVGGWFLRREADYRRSGAVGPRPHVEHDADPQTRLLAMFGRSAPPDPAAASLAAVDRFGAAFDRQDLDAVMLAMTADCVFESTAPPDGIRHVGQEQVRRAWADFFEASAGAAFTTERRFAAGDRVVVHWRYDWTGDDPGHVRGVDVFTIREGLVAEKLAYVKG